MSSFNLETKENLSVKIHPSLAQAAMRQRVDREYRLWTLARALDAKGSGRVRIADLRELIEAEDLNGLAAGSLRRLLREGSPVFWTVADHDADRVLYLTGLRRLCLALGLTRLAQSPVLMPIRWARSLKAFRAVCYASGFPTDVMSNPISRRAIERNTGRTPRTQRGYDQALSRQLQKRDNARIIDRKPKEGIELSSGLFVDKVRTRGGDESFVLLQRLPNSYRIGFERGPRGMMRRVNRELRDPFRYVGKGKREKLFYRNARNAARRIQQRNETDWFCVSGVIIRGRQVQQTVGRTALWTNIQQVNGKVYFC